ncbi:MAG: hypothetical protein HY842_15030 [Bacteroidetes bacterium]|nr:hypothetical protein [Bacteroidota bacterium]
MLATSVAEATAIEVANTDYNTDWWATNTHNLDIFRPADNAAVPIPIPHDFDYAGSVEAPYAVASKKPGRENVRERFCQALCRPEVETGQTIRLFLGKKAALLDYCEQFPHFSNYSRSYALKYLRSFFDPPGKRAKNSAIHFREL